MNNDNKSALNNLYSIGLQADAGCVSADDLKNAVAAFVAESGSVIQAFRRANSAGPQRDLLRAGLRAFHDDPNWACEE